MYYYNYNYQIPTYNTISQTTIALIAAGIAALVAIILFFTVLRKKNEGRFHGGAKKFYDFLNINRFYTEDIIRFLYVISVFAVTVAGIAYIVMGKFAVGAALIVGGNIAARLVFELIIVCMVLVRRTVSIDRRLSKIEKFYDDNYDDWDDCSKECDDSDDDFDCTGECEACHADCSQEFRSSHEAKTEKGYRDYNKEYNPSVIYAGHVEKEKLSAPTFEDTIQKNDNTAASEADE